MSVVEKIKKGWVHPKIKDSITHNRKVMAGRKQTMANNLEGLVSDQVNHHFNVKRGRAVFIPPNAGIVKVKQNFCSICGDHDTQMVSGSGASDGAWYCREHKSVRNFSLTEQNKIRSEYVKKQNQ